MRVVLALMLLFLALATSADSATYYVSTTGNNANAGTEASPWRTITHASTIMAAGDTVYVRGGTYTTEGSIWIRRSGTQANPIRLLAYPGETPIISYPTHNSAQRILVQNSGGQNVAIAWITISGLEITGSWDGIKFYSCQDCTFTYNYIHDNIHQGILGVGGLRVLITRNIIARNGDFDGCIAEAWKCNQDHGIYAHGSSYTITNNLFYGNMGYGVQQNGSGTAAYSASKHPSPSFAGAADWIVAKNTFAYQVNRGGMVVWSSQCTNSRIENNIFYENASNNASVPQGIQFTSATCTGVQIRNNLFYATGAGGTAGIGSGAPPGMVQSGNSTNTLNPGFVNAGATIPGSPNFALTASSPAINFGRVNEFPYNGSAPDAGAFETFAPIAATANGAFVDITLQGANIPLQPSGAAGWSIGCNDCGTLTVANVTMLSPAIVRLHVTGWTGGQCAAGKTITASFNGTLLDSARIGDISNQHLHSFSNYAVTNQCETGGPPPSLDPELILYEFDGDVQDSSGGGHHGTLQNGTYVEGKYGQALLREIGTEFRVIAPYGEGINLTEQDLTVCTGYHVPVGQETANSIILGSALGTNQRFHVEARGGTWQVAVQSSPTSGATPCYLTVKSGYNRVCVRVDSTAQTAQLFVDNIAGTGSALKSFTSFTLASDLSFGLPIGITSGPEGGGGIWDRSIVWTSLQSIEDDWLAWEPPSPPAEGSYAHVGHRFNKIRGNAAQYGAVGGSVEVIQGGAVAITTQTVCEGESPCSAIGERLWYARNGGQAQPVPDEMTSDQVAFYGQASGLYTGPTTGCFVGEPAECYDGTTQLTSIALPEIHLAAGEAITRRSVLRFGAEASGQYCFTERDQTGNELPGGAVPACVRIVPPMMSAGF